MTLMQRITTWIFGIVSGLAAISVFFLLMGAFRLWLGVPTLAEAIPDRIAPTLSISEFFKLFGEYGGYNGLKRFGITSSLQGIAAAAMVVGLIHAIVAESRWSKRRDEVTSGVSKGATLVTAIISISALTAVLIFLSGTLHTNFRGLPLSSARLLTIGCYIGMTIIFVCVLSLVYRWTVRLNADEKDESPELKSRPTTRRAAIAVGAGAMLAIPSWAMFQTLSRQTTYAYDGRAYSGPGVEPIVPNDKFYSVTKNVVDPDVDADQWRLEIFGLVERERSWSLEELKAEIVIEQETTLMCISNQIGSGLAGNAVWTGVSLPTLLEDAGLKDGAVEVKIYGADGYTDTIAIAKAMDPTTLVVFRMNGEILPRKHGYPVRLIVPGKFGEKHVKWLTGIEVIDHDGKGFYEQQGWGPDFDVPTRSDIFSPQWKRHRTGDDFTKSFRANAAATIRGRAFAGDRGVKSVDFSWDNGNTWHSATIDYAGTKLTWVFWSYEWTPPNSGEYVLTCRATDFDGGVQEIEQQGIAPQGARGLHKVRANVERK